LRQGASSKALGQERLKFYFTFWSMSMNIGESVVSDMFITTNGLETNFDKYRGQWIVLYFYPKDATSGCTLEGQAFRDKYAQFLAHHAIVFGVSRDSLKSHENFKVKQNFPFELISDSDEKLCDLFGVIKMKSMYGKQYLGIERSTFLIDPAGIIRHVWRKVKVKGHVDEVFDTLLSVQRTNG
jgi:peroxiredoxin Q/BCP